MGKRGPLPLDSPLWVPLDDFRRRGWFALAELYTGLTKGKPRSMVCVEDRQGQLIRRLLPRTFWPDKQLELWSAAGDGITDEVRVLGPDGKPLSGWFYVWSPDLKVVHSENYPETESKPQQVGPPPPKTPAKSGRPPKHDWLALGLEASGLIRNNLAITQAEVIKKLRESLAFRGKEEPAKSELQDLFKQVQAFEKKYRK